MLALLAKYKIAVIVVALLGALGVGAGSVAAASGTLPVALSAVNSGFGHTNASGSSRHNRGLWAGLTHGSILTKVNGAYVTYTVDAGKVTAASSSSLTLQRLDGTMVTLTITSNTVWGAKRAEPANPTKLVGRRILVFSQHGAAIQVGRGNGVLKNIVHADLTLYHNGKTRQIQIDRGVIQSASATQISVKRADGAVVTEPVAAKARWTQTPGHKQITPSQITPNEAGAIVSENGQVIAVRVRDVESAGA